MNTRAGPMVQATPRRPSAGWRPPRRASTAFVAIVAFALSLVAGAVTPAAAQERITSYDTEVRVLANGALDVTERITVVAEGIQIRRGIYRDFPTRYRDRYGNRVRVDFEVVSVERDGRPEPWFTERLSNGVRVNFGDDSFLPVPAEYTYTLRYRTTRQLGFFDTHDELYWNAIGTGWVFAIESGTVEVILPEPVAVDSMGVEAYTGAQGERGTAYRATLPAPGVAHFELTEPLAPRQGFTVVVTFPKGIVTPPAWHQRVRWLLADNRGLLAALVGWLGVLVFCVRRWHEVGRDPATRAVIPRYEPPTGHSPAGLRYLRRMGYDVRCFTAEILALAVAGHLRIGVEERRLRKDQWYIERTGPLVGGGAGSSVGAPAARIPKPAGPIDATPFREWFGGLVTGDAGSAAVETGSGGDGDNGAEAAVTSSAAGRGSGATAASRAGGLLPPQRALLAALFEKGEDRLVLTNKNASRLLSARVAHRKALDEAYHGRYFDRNSKSTLLAAVIALAAIMLSFRVSGGDAQPAIALVAALIIGTVVVFSRAVRARTKEGAELLNEIEGLRLYLGVAERDELASLAGPGKPPVLDASRYEALLPFAVALEVEEAWTRKFSEAVGDAAAQAATSSMTWYRGSNAMSLNSFSQAIGSSLSSQIAAASKAPGSSSGAGGGGSAGGGGGGGGGGGR